MEAVSGKNLKMTAPIVLARWERTAYKGNSVTRNLAEVVTEMENTTNPGMGKDIKPQKVNMKKGFISGQVWEVDIGKE